MFERMLDKEHKPEMEDIYSYLGDKKEMFLSLNDYLVDEKNLQFEIRFPYGNKYGWAITY